MADRPGPNYRAIEHLGAAYYAARGFRVHLCATDKKGWDFIVVKGDTVLRVDVKRGRIRGKGKGSREFSISGRTHSCDVYLVWFPDGFIEVKRERYQNWKTRNLKIPAHMKTEPILPSSYEQVKIAS